MDYSLKLKEITSLVERYDYAKKVAKDISIKFNEVIFTFDDGTVYKINMQYQQIDEDVRLWDAEQA